VSFYTHELRVGAFYAGDAVVDLLMTGVFVWLAFTRDRWWPLIMSAIMALTLLVYVSSLVIPDLGPYAVISARIGLGILCALTLLFGACERWLVGEQAVSDREAWARRRRSPGQGHAPAAPPS
jgi:type VI protein secretion system component VasK